MRLAVLNDDVKKLTTLLASINAMQNSRQKKQAFQEIVEVPNSVVTIYRIDETTGAVLPDDHQSMNLLSIADIAVLRNKSEIIEILYTAIKNAGLKSTVLKNAYDKIYTTKKTNFFQPTSDPFINTESELKLVSSLIS